MDSELVSNSLSTKEESDNDKAVSFTTYSDKFNEFFPYYLSIGMTGEEYWDGDNDLVISYRKVDEIKQERLNQEKWLQGMYIYDALCRIAPIFHAFAKKGTKPKPYPSEPYSITTKQMETKEEEKVKTNYDKGKQFMEQFLIETNKKFKKT